jgi:hypothetical protein
METRGRGVELEVELEVEVWTPLGVAFFFLAMFL